MGDSCAYRLCVIWNKPVGSLNFDKPLYSVYVLILDLNRLKQAKSSELAIWHVTRA
jgi:hypothetical protein